MRRPRRRPMHYSASTLFDGTVLAARPIRKPTPKIIKRDNLKIDEEGVCVEWPRSGKELSDIHNDTRTRFQDIIATSLNTRRALRELVLPELAALRAEVAAVRSQLDRIDLSLAEILHIPSSSKSPSGPA
jgi:hypothetical protein